MPFYVYGPVQKENSLIPYIIKCVKEGKKPNLKTPSTRNDFIYVEDIVDAYLKFLSIPKIPQKHEIFDIGTGNPVSVKKVVSEIDNIINTKLKPE